ncbi:MAG: MATE family efflux transporter [Marinifilaceae bacterium]
MFKRSHRNIPLKEYKKTLALSLPVIIAQAGQITVGLTDNMMIGHLGCTELAAASFTNTLFQLIVIFGMGFSFSLTPLVGQQMAHKNHSKIGEWLKNGLRANFSLGMILVLVLGVLAMLIPYMNQPESIIVPSREYLLLLILSVLPMQMFYAFKQFFEGIGNTKISMVIMLLANIINIAGNYFFMYGKFGCPEMGLLGAAVGTVLSRVFMAVAAYVCFAKFSIFKIYYSAFKEQVSSHVQVKKLYSMGLPLGGHMVMEASAFGLCTIMIGWINEVSLAAHQIALSLSTLGFMVYQGIGAATTIRVSHLVGEKNIDKIKSIKTVSIHICLIYCLFIIALFILGRDLLPQLFTSDEGVIHLASGMLVLCAVFQVSDGSQIIIAGVLRGFADVKMPAFITFLSYFVIALPVSYLAAFKFGAGAIGMWYGFPIGLTAAYLMFYFRYKRLLKKSRS